MYSHWNDKERIIAGCDKKIDLPITPRTFSPFAGPCEMDVSTGRDNRRGFPVGH